MTELVLQLAIEGEYFQAILDGEKTQEFRLANPYWHRRIVNRKYDKLILTWGYPSKTDKKRRIEMPYTGYEYLEAMQHKHFGENFVPVFAVNIAPRDQWTHDPALPHKKT